MPSAHSDLYWTDDSGTVRGDNCCLRKLIGFCLTWQNLKQAFQESIDTYQNRITSQNPVKKFWATMMNEELMHAKIFDEIREKVKADESIQFEINIDMGQLKGFVDKVNKLLQEIKNREVTESEAYSFGAHIEVQLDEANFTKKISTNDPEVKVKIEQIETETKKHRMVLVNFSKGIR